MGEISTSFAYETHQTMENESIKLSFTGEFTSELITVLLLMAKQNIGGRAIMKKVYNVMIECLENLTKHTPQNSKDNSIFLLGNSNDAYFIATGNKIDNFEKEALTNHLEKINSCNKDQLWDLYNDILVNGKISDKGGAGLGLIDIAIKSENKLEYAFSNIDDKYSFFELKVKIDG